ncbi:MAG: MBL fold metallo-hydrolase [Desulfurococcales archaeon ex4484_58]|nr:MAG: MBL fold metallo-hydrolase [Desulfurococcales archaeon ex4484_58]
MVKTITHKLFDNLYLLRLDDDQIKYFESLWYIPEGITYNAYLLDTGDGAVLFDTWRKNYSELFVEELKKIIDPRDIKYLIVHHMEPDHSGAIKELVELNPEIIVYGHQFTKRLINSFYNVDPKFKSIDDGEVLEFNGYRIKFIHTPWIHWPETMFSYLENYKVLFTCDGFGSYGIFDAIYVDELRENIGEYMWYMKKYLADIVGHYIDWVVKALEKLDSLKLNIELIAPSHGLIWRRPGEAISKYLEWIRGSDGRRIVVIYSSMYGFLEEAVKYVVKVLEEEGVEYRVHGFTATNYSSVSDLLGDLLDSSGIIIATATYESNIFPYMRYIIELIREKIIKKKKILVISNYGWGPVAGHKILESLKNTEHEIVDLIEFNAGQMDKYREKIKEGIIKLIAGLRK